MLPQKIAFVDIETTGTSLRSDRIIEIGVLRVENNQVIDTYRSLVNPETYVPAEIEGLTGIRQEDLENAPTFPTIKKDLLNILGDCIFAAHNVRFDYGFVRSELKREGVAYRAKNLCTVKLSRSLFPRFKRHSLDAVMERCGISCENRHRAFDDAQVIWEFY